MEKKTLRIVLYIIGAVLFIIGSGWARRFYTRDLPYIVMLMLGGAVIVFIATKIKPDKDDDNDDDAQSYRRYIDSKNELRDTSSEVNTSYTHRTESAAGAVQRTESHGTQVEKQQPQEPELKSMFVRNYYPGLPIQAVALQLIIKDKNTVFAGMDFYRYNESVYSAVSADIEFTTVFGDLIVFRDIPYTNIPNFGVILHAAEQPVPIDIYKIKSINTVNIRIKKYIADGIITENSKLSQDTSLSERELSDLKYLEGINAVCLRKDTSDGWICICGTENEASGMECSFCRRPKGDSTNLVGDTLNLLVDKLESLNNAREIKDYLVEYNLKYRSEHLEGIISDLKDTILTERMYGNQKQAALKKIKEKLIQ